MDSGPQGEPHRLIDLNRGRRRSTDSPAHAVAVYDSVVALVGGYNEHRRRVVVADLDAGTSTTFRLALPGGEEVPDGTSVLARGSEIHAVVDARWFAVDIQQIV